MKIDAGKLRALIKSHGLTNTNLAAQAGISRQALHAILRGDHVVEVRERTVKGLVHALRLPDELLLSPDPFVGYKEAVADENVDLPFHRSGLSATEPRSMDEVFVPIRLVPMQDRERDCQLATDETDEKPIAESEELPIEVSEHLPVDHVLAWHRRVLIIGEPGSGKSTTLRHVARAYAQGPVAEGRYSKRAAYR